MFKWLSRYVKQINILGVGIELREIPEEEALTLLSSKPTPASSEQAPAGSQVDASVVKREDYICVSGTSASSKRMPRDMDLMAEGDEIQIHVHPPGGSQPKLWVGREALQQSFDQWKQSGGGAGPITVPGRTARKEAEVVFVVDDSSEVEVQAGWWIWVSRQDLKLALEQLGVRVPW